MHGVRIKERALKIRKKLDEAIKTGKAKKEDLAKIKKGLYASVNVYKHRKKLQKELKKELNVKKIQIIMDKLEMIDQMLSYFRKMEIEKAKLIAHEYDKKYPNDLDD